MILFLFQMNINYFWADESKKMKIDHRSIALKIKKKLKFYKFFICSFINI